MDREKTADRQTAERIYNTDIYEMRNADETPESIAEKLGNPDFCKETINYLLDIIDELQG